MEIKHPTLLTARFVTLVERNQRDSGLDDLAEILACQPTVRQCSCLYSEDGRGPGPDLGHVGKGPQEQGPGAMGRKEPF